MLTQKQVARFEKRGMVGLAQFWADSVCGIHATHVAICLDQKQIIGFFRFTIAGRTLRAAGTWVDPRHRHRGLAKALWTTTLKRYRPEIVSVITISRGGTKLIRSLIKADGLGLITWLHNAT